MLFSKLDVITVALRKVGAVICDFLYTIISLLYQLFTVIARLDILSTVEIKPIYQRVTMILTIVMTFYITFEFVKYTIQPDTFTDKEKGVGNLLQRIVIVVILIAFVPTIFEYAMKLQNRVIETQVISKVIIGNTGTDYKSYGREFSSNMLSLFYYVDDRDENGACYNDNGADCNLARTTVEDNMNNLKQHGISTINIGIALPSVKILKLDVQPAIKFHGIMAIIVGGFIVYMLAMYCIDLGSRYFQLIFLQIMSPIAIMGYILPKKDGIFQKWIRQCITTYIDVFLRIAIISFVLLLISVLGDAFDNGTIFGGISENVSWLLKGLTYVALVMGLLMFANRAPKLLGELFPSMGSAGIGFGLSSKGRIEPTTKAIKGVAKTASNVANTGARVAGGVGGLIAGAKLGKNFGERLRYAAAGGKAGFDKNNKGLPYRRIERAQEAARQRQYKEDEIARNVPGEVDREEAVRQAMYHKERYANIAAEQDRKAKLFEVPSSSMDNINKSIDEFKQIKALKQAVESAKARGADAATVRSLDGQYKSAVQAVRGAVAKSMDANGNFDEKKFDQLIQQGVKFTYKELDENGFAKDGGVVQDYNLQIDKGDKNYVGSVARSIDNEYKKAVATTDELKQDKEAFNALQNSKGVDITIDVNGTEKEITASVDAWLNGVVKDKTGAEIKLNDEQRRAIYAEFVNKFKDAMVDPKNAYENTSEYIAAHAYKDGIDNGGGKK